MSTIRLNELDRKILHYLIQNGKASSASLSRKVGLSRSAVSHRIRKLEESGVIRGYRAQVSLLGNSSRISSYLFISCSKGTSREVCRMLSSYPEIRTTSLTSGTFNIVAIIEARDISALGELCHRIESNSNIDKIHNNIIIDEFSYNPTLEDG